MKKVIFYSVLLLTLGCLATSILTEYAVRLTSSPVVVAQEPTITEVNIYVPWLVGREATPTSAKDELTAVASPTATPTHTPKPTLTTTPTYTPVSTHTPTPTATESLKPQDTPTPTPTSTTLPTWTPEPTLPSSTVEPTLSPTPSVTPYEIATEAAADRTPAPCYCHKDLYNCEDFYWWPFTIASLQEYAQECFEYCYTWGEGGDIHNLDPDSNGIACDTCKSPLPPPLPLEGGD